MELLFLEPIFKQRIWGGYKLKTNYGYSIPSNQTGECWAISAHPNGETRIRNGQYAGIKLSELWHQHPELFANTTPRPFPLMVKILDANDKLSVQVHPNDQFAQEVEHDLGKAECWYVLDATPQAQIIYGHNAQSSDQFKQLALAGKWSSLLKTTPIKTGDFFDVPTGTVHALGAGALILEIQQSSDTTYRIYDYDRTDDQGNLRELHLDKAFAVVNCPHRNHTNSCVSQNLTPQAQVTNLTTNQYFQVTKLTINDYLELNNIKTNYLIVSVIEGKAILNGQSIQKGDHFIIPNQIRELKFIGYVTLIICHETN
ncbi:MAG: hypothetical protein RLZZ293_797 [Pseudomonadota bacterium]|jgi:mannose-6-phosphate isomerase